MPCLHQTFPGFWLLSYCSFEMGAGRTYINVSLDYSSLDFVESWRMYGKLVDVMVI